MASLFVSHSNLDRDEAERLAQRLHRWRSMGRQVLKGRKAAEILRPITISKKIDDGEVESTFTSFKFVRCLFTYSQTEGDDIPKPEVPEWSLDRALDALDITRVPMPC